METQGRKPKRKKFFRWDFWNLSHNFSFLVSPPVFSLSTL